MASFCQRCGFPQSPTSSFCPQCGTQHAAGGGGPVAQPATLPAAQSGSGLKVVLVVVACLGVAGVAIIGGLYYVAHKVKQAVVSKAAENGVDLSSISSPVSHAYAPRPKIRKPCDYLSKEEASRLIGEPLERMVAQDAVCLYYGPAGLSAKLAQEQASKAFKHAQQPDSHLDVSEFENIDQLAGSLGMQSGQVGSGGDAPLLMLGVDPDGRAQMTALTASNAIFGGIYKAAEAKGMSFGGDVPNLGDKAVRLPKLGLNVLQGEILIRVIPGPLPESDKKAIDVARAVLPRI
jgi:hypothetical protein